MCAVIQRAGERGKWGMTTEIAARRRSPLWFVAIAVALIVLALSFPPGSRMARRFFDSLREQKVQAVNVDLSTFVGPNANPTLQQLVQQMISDKVNVTVNEQDQPARD